MKKIISLILMLITFGIGQMWGADVTVSWSASSNSLGSAIASVNGTASGTIATTGTNVSYNWSYTRTLKNLASKKSDHIAMSGQYMQMGSSNAGENVEFRTSNIPGTIKSVTVNVGTKSSAHTGTITVGGTTYTTSPASVPAWSNSSGSNWTGTGTSSGEIVISFSVGSNKNPLYVKSISVTYNNDGGGGGGGCSAPAAPTISGTAAYTEGQTITLTAACASGSSASTTYTWYKGNTWDAASATTPVQAASTSGATFTKANCVEGDAGTYWCKASNGSGCESHNATGKAITVSAAATTEYELVTSTEDLEAGAKYLIGNGTSGSVNFVSTASKGNNRDLTSGTVTNSKVTKTSSMMALTLGGSSGAWTFATNNYGGTAGYLNATNTTSNNYLKVVADLDDYAYFSISFSSNAAVITCTGKASRNIVRYNGENNSNVISCYTSGYAAVYLYKEVPTTATLKFDLNGKTLSQGSAEKPSNVTNLTLSQAYNLSSLNSVGLTATGYTFAGWNTNKNAASSQSSITPSEATTYTLYAIWTPNTNTAYTVKHYKQNLDGSYPSSPTETDNLTGTTDASVTPARKSYTGFTAPNGQTVTILPDGSRVVTYNYTRNSYALTWSTDGDALSGNYTTGNTKYEAPITAPNTPTKTGYVFDAWSPTPASTMPAEAKTYTATWTCKTPEIETDLNTAQVDYIKDVTATALLISASANGASLNYAWEKSANGTSGWSPVGTNNSSYTPLTDEVGDQYYRCTVTNASAGCSSATATSKVAHIHVVAPSVCLTPSFSPATGTYVGSQNVEISSTAGATIYYTTDGSDPTTSETRKTYSSAFSIGVTTTIRAYAEKAEMTASEEGSATITIKCADPTFSSAGGSFTSAQNVSLATEYGDEIYYTTDGSDPATNGTKYTSAIAVSTTNTTIKAVAKKENCANSDLATATYTIACATPTFSPEAGTYTGTQNVTISSTDGATIYYTTDGTTPDNTKSVYSSAIPVSANTTIKAIAVKDGLSQSAIGSATYSIKYTVTLNAGTGSVSDGSWTESEGVWTKAQTAVGGSITLPNATSGVSGWNFSGWKTESAVTTQTDVKPDYVATTYTPTSDITLYAVYEKTSGSADYTLVESDLGTAWAGDYLIAASSTAFADGRKGGKDDDGSIGRASVSVNPSTNLSGKVVAASWGDTYNVTLEEILDGETPTNTYILKTKDGKYNYRTANSNGLDATANKATAAEYPISVTFNSSSNIALASSAGPIFKYNPGTSGQPATYFRFYASGQNPIYLYKKGEATKSYYSNPSDKVTLTYDKNGATAGEAPSAQGNITIGTGVTVAAKPEGLANTGYDFGGWNTKADGTGTNYTAGTDEITMTDNITLYAKWTKHNFTVAVASVDHTAITATPEGGSAIAEGSNAAVAYEKEVTLAKTDDPHFTAAWDVYETGNSSNKVTVSENKFTVPAFNVTVSATITEAAKRNVKFYSNGTQLGTTQEVYVGEAPVAETAVYEDCLEGSNMFYGWATEEWTGAIDASTLAGKTVHTGALPDVATGEGDVNYYAVWAKATTTFQKGTSADLKNGQKVVIVHNNSSKALENNDTWAGTDVTINTNQISDPASTIQWTVETTTNGFYLKNGSNQYLKGQNKSGGPYILLTNTTNKWTLTNDGTYVLKDENNRYLEYYSNAFTTFGSYSSNNANCYVMDFYVPVMGDFRTNCCGLKPVTNVQVGTIGETSIELTWNAPTSKTGITKYQIVDAEHEIAQDVTNVDAIKATVTGLTECTTYNFKVVSVGDGCNSNSNEVEATPFAGAKIVTFDYNGGSGATTSASTSCGVATVNLPTPNARDGYNFKGWNDGTQTLAPSTATYTPAATMTLTAQWAQLYTVHYEFAGASGAPEDAQYEAGATVELPSEPNKGFLAPFEAWDYSEAVTMVDETHFEMPASYLTITATYDEIVGQWILVTDESTLRANDTIVIGSGANNAVAGEISSQVMASVSASFSTDKTVLTAVPNNAAVLKLGGTSSAWTLNRLSDNKKLGATAEKKLAWDGTSATETWTISIEDNDATIQNGTSSYGNLQYNSGSPRFTTYTSSQTLPQIYRFREGTFYNVNMPASAPTGGTVSANTSMAKAGETVMLTYTPSRGYTVKTLTVTGATSGSIAISPALEAGVTEYTFTMPSEAVTVAASFEAVPAVEYHMVENASDIPMGMQFVMLGTKADGSEPYVIGEMNNSNRLAGDAVEASAIDAVNKTLSLTTEAAVDYTMDGETGSFKIKYNNQYLEAGSGNTVRWSNTGDAWAIAISEGKATITSGDYKLNYNPSQHWVAAYTNAQQPVTLYALPYTTYNFVLDGCKTIKVVTGYTYTYTIKNSDEPSSTPGDNYTFLHKWTDGTNTYAVGDEVTVSAAKTLQPCWKVTTPTDQDVTDIDGLPESVKEIVVNVSKELNVNDNRTINTLTIKSTSGAFEVDGTSGQVTGSSTLTVTDNLYLEIQLRSDAMDAEASRKWYCIAAPFDVNINGGFFWGDGTPMYLNVDFQLFEWDGDRRASGASGWRRTSGIMKKDTAYFIGFDDERANQNTIKLKAMNNTISNRAKIVAPTHSGSAEAATYGNWNGLANPNFHHIALNKNVQAFDYNKQGYSPYATGEYNFVVGTPFFIQYAGDIAVSAANGSNPYRAPQRESDIYSYCVRIGSAEASRADNQIYVRASETASAEFDNEHDMITLNNTSSNYGALLWTENYGGKRLAIEEAPLVNGTASYVLTLSAPKAGTYSISVAAPQDNADLYLTYEGTIIWNLSEGAYTMDLNKGITNGYGLILRANAPSAATGIDEAESGKQKAESVQKIILDEKVFILRGGKMYDVTGKAVK